VNALEAELTEARAAIEKVQHRTDEEIAAFKQQYPAALQFAYGTQKYEKPFYVRSIWNDGQFTYIKTDAHELPALYEMKDGEPSLVNFQVQGGTYVVPKVLDRGYLALGKDKFSFQQGR
jgi:type IV secretion system protein VirB9